MFANFINRFLGKTAAAVKVIPVLAAPELRSEVQFKEVVQYVCPEMPKTRKVLFNGKILHLNFREVIGGYTRTCPVAFDQLTGTEDTISWPIESVNIENTVDGKVHVIEFSKIVDKGEVVRPYSVYNLITEEEVVCRVKVKVKVPVTQGE